MRKHCDIDDTSTRFPAVLRWAIAALLLLSTGIAAATSAEDSTPLMMASHAQLEFQTLPLDLTTTAPSIFHILPVPAIFGLFILGLILVAISRHRQHKRLSNQGDTNTEIETETKQ